MNDKDTFSLSMKNFSDEICGTWMGLQQDSVLTDVTLACDEYQVKVHKIILCTSSQFFNQVLQQNCERDEVIILQGINPLHLKYIVEFIYQGKISIDHDQLDEFLTLGNDFKVKGLTQINPSKKIKETEKREQNLKSNIKKKKSAVKPKPKKLRTADQRILENNQSYEENDIQTNFEHNTSFNELDSNFLEFTNYNEKSDKKLNAIIPETNYDKTNDIECNMSYEIFSDRSPLSQNLPGFNTENEKDNRLEVNTPEMSNEETLYVEDHKSFKSISQSPPQSLNPLIQESQFSCKKCDYISNVKEDFKKHNSIVHKVKKFQCTDCNYRATQKASLQTHTNAVHKGVRYSCDKCDYKSTTKGNLKKHVDGLHNGVRYPCELCSYKATQISSLNTHTRITHSL